MDGMKVAVVRNPASGRGSGGKTWPELKAALRASVREFTVEETTAPGSGAKQARRLAEQGWEIIVAAGGDGTVCDVMQGVLGTQSALGVLPMGTGNDFSRTLGIGTDQHLAVTTITKGRRERIDVGRWTQGDRQGHFIKDRKSVV